MEPCIICVAITGSLPRKSLIQLYRSAFLSKLKVHAAFEEGATIMHAHVKMKMKRQVVTLINLQS